MSIVLLPPKTVKFHHYEKIILSFTKKKDFTSLIDMSQINHVTVIGPTSKFHEAFLLVKREKFDINFAGGFINGGWIPGHLSRIM